MGPRDELIVAADAAQRAGEVLCDGFSRTIEVSKKGRRELVTEMDRASERIIIDAIRAAYPDDHIVAEESAPRLAASKRVWFIDPLDGTNNYAHGYPFFCVAIALEEDGQLVGGVVLDPLRGERFVAERGLGATLNGARIRVSAAETLGDSIVATGFPYDRSADTDNNLANLNRFILAVRGIRRGGSAELDLVYVACGRLDGFWELGLKAWDVAAGGIIALEAGGQVTNMSGEGWNHRRGDIVASNGRIHGEMRAIVSAGSG